MSKKRSHGLLSIQNILFLQAYCFQFASTADLDDESTLRKHEIVPGATLTMRVWPEDSWGQLVAAAASGKIKRLQTVGVTQTSSFSTANSKLMTEETRNDWTALHVAVTSGQVECISTLLEYGARASDEDNEGHNAVQLARLWKQRESERRLFRHRWMVRTGGHFMVGCYEVEEQGMKVGKATDEFLTPMPHYHPWIGLTD
ncbi:ANKRD60: Ankyrin repeat domain-containing protein 60 [Crotalus adamanteus]|uniref:ANKRD60: Ankyrin repeat domain-containing protein 60 n=1 Tax=Crotalus adamanteus TaxID=8729 RepID=A0AAW1BRN1_CROAD